MDNKDIGNDATYMLIKNFYKMLNFNNYVSISSVPEWLNVLKYCNKKTLIISSSYNLNYFINMHIDDNKFDTVLCQNKLSSDIQKSYTTNVKDFANVEQIYGSFDQKRNNSEILIKLENKYDSVIVYSETYNYNNQVPAHIAVIAPLIIKDIVLSLNSLKDKGNLLFVCRVSVLIPSIKKIIYLLSELFDKTNVYDGQMRTFNIDAVNFNRTKYNEYKKTLIEISNEINETEFENISLGDKIFYKNNKTISDIEIAYDINLNCKKTVHGKKNIEQIKTLYLNYISYVNKKILLYAPFDNKEIVKTELYKLLEKIIYEFDKNNLAYNKYYLTLTDNLDTNVMNYLYGVNENINIAIVNYSDIKGKHIGTSENYSWNEFENLFAKLTAVNKEMNNIINVYGIDISEKLTKFIEDFTRGINHYLHKQFNIPFVPSNAFSKLWELYIMGDLFEGTDINTFHFCEAPGQFVKCTQYYIEKKLKNVNHKWWANSLNPYNKNVIEKYGANLFRDHFGLIKNNRNNWIWGDDDTGDITKPKNIKWFRNFFAKTPLNFVTGDGGLSVDDSNLETLQKLDFAQFVMSVAVSVIGGHCIIKVFTPFIAKAKETKKADGFFVGLMFMYNLFFEEINLIKPYSSSVTSGEFYVIGKKFKGIDDSNLDKFYDMLDNFKENQTLIKKEEIPKEFVKQIYVFLEKMTDLNVRYIDRLNFFMTCKLDDNEMIRTKTNCMHYIDDINLKNYQEGRFKKWIAKFKFE